MLDRRQILTGLAALLLTAAPLRAEETVFYAPGGAALDGYDVVEYFHSGEAKRGTDKHVVMWKGVDWYFISAANREAFEANPRGYAPQFGGYCAYAVANGYTAATDPHAWHIVDGKLYLTHSPRADQLWQKDIAGNIARAARHWPKVLGE
ncbi:YHS domain-containing (seleno)protein [Lutimaribacter marinistellae]|uniref:YHS domain-containing (Seleno)protein n=1 Tax=Lutimaribacter marinistellae TaxID=1820329 RepID=A0ABV7TJ33_9RHOB